MNDSCGDVRKYVAIYGNLRSQEGAGVSKEAVSLLSGANTQVDSFCMLSSYPVLHVYVAVSPTELPVSVTRPLAGAVGLAHRAVKTNCYS